jgi:hypothetical protein
MELLPDFKILFITAANATKAELYRLSILRSKQNSFFLNIQKAPFKFMALKRRRFNYLNHPNQ